MITRRTLIQRLVSTGVLTLASPAVVVAQNLTTLRVGSVALDSFAEALYGHDAGIFARAGLNLEIVPFTNGAGSTTAIAGGAIDIGISTVTMMANAAIHGLPLVYIAGGALFDGTPNTALVVAKTSKIANAKDFVGKKVAVSGLKDGTHLPFVVWLTKNGVDPASVSVIEMPFPSMVPAITRGTIDGAVCGEPFITLGVDDVRVLAIVHTALAPRFMTGGWLTSAAWAKANAPLAKRFAAAMYETARWSNKNRDATGDILAKYTKLDRGVIGRMTRTDFADTLNRQLLAPSLDWAYKMKFIEREVSSNEMIADLG